jgi:sulfate transport system ATP-binding protein
MSIEVRHITKRFGRFTALKDVSLGVPTGELVALLGPSGSGKTTLLRIIAGLEQPDEGAVLFDQADTTGRPVQDRRVGFVFQHYALFRHMTVFENVAFGLRVRPRRWRPDRKEIEERARKLLSLVQLESMCERYPSQLSGGQRQRVALARALAVEPKVLLLDEPFGALDAKVRAELRGWLRRLHDEIKMTSVFVTHDQEEALEVADRVAVLNAGAIEQVGTPEEVYHHPATPFIYDFLGRVNVFHGRVVDGRTYLSEKGTGAPAGASPEGQPATVFVRPHHLDIAHHSNGEGGFRARVQHINPAGALVRVELITEWGQPVQVELTQERHKELGLSRDATVYVTPKELKVFADDYTI